ncbi:hypothetical protein V1525DRAFT_390520 [Lipomyces kononenkoae]|uniref:Uncharacterized protein n=1 Tax=Lipomyces kononenkoae TaxID=34357 RepID=A0ACC3SX78_LIPKO
MRQIKLFEVPPVGTKVAIIYAKPTLVGAVSLIHPSRLVELDADGIEEVPVLTIATRDEKREALECLVSKLNKVAYVRYDDMFHGFAAAR